MKPQGPLNLKFPAHEVSLDRVKPGLAARRQCQLAVSLDRVKPHGLALASSTWLGVRTVRYTGMFEGPVKLPPVQCSLHLELHMEQHMKQHMKQHPLEHITDIAMEAAHGTTHRTTHGGVVYV